MAIFLQDAYHELKSILKFFCFCTRYSQTVVSLKGVLLGLDTPVMATTLRRSLIVWDTPVSFYLGTC